MKRFQPIIESHPLSRRECHVVDDGKSVWLFLTAPQVDGEPLPEIMADVFVLNRIPPILPGDVSNYRGGQPPITSDFATPFAFSEFETREELEIRWSADGHSAALLKNKNPIACIIQAEKQGYSKAISSACAWGNPWSQEQFDHFFETNKS